jgi:hypothetical protein
VCSGGSGKRRGGWAGEVEIGRRERDTVVRPVAEEKRNKKQIKSDR